MLDLIIIGGGPAGYVAARLACERGLEVVLFEKKELGGICVNEGCIPTKTLLYSAKIYDTVLNSAKYGISAGQAGFDFGKVAARKNKVVRKLILGIAAQMKEAGVNIIKGEAFIKGRVEDGFEVECGGESYRASKLLICTGSQSVIPPIEGTQGADVVTSGQLLAAKELPASLVIIGGGVIGMEFASLYNSFGVRVSVVEMQPEILPGTDREMAAMLRKVYVKKGVGFHLQSKVLRIEDGEVVCSGPGFSPDSHSDAVENRIQGEKIVLCVGRKPVIEGFGLEKLGVETERGGIKVNDKMETNVPGVYAAGDVTGFWMFAHAASREGEVVVNNLTGRPDRMSYRAVPAVVYTNPETASAGLDIEAARAQGIQCRELRLSMAFSGRFVAENEGEEGLCKIVVDESNNRVVGVQMIGNVSSEIIFGACMAIDSGMDIDELKKIIFPHPTVSDILKETLMQAGGK